MDRSNKSTILVWVAAEPFDEINHDATMSVHSNARCAVDDALSVLHDGWAPHGMMPVIFYENPALSEDDEQSIYETIKNNLIKASKKAPS